MRKFVYLGSMFKRNEVHEDDIERRVKAGNKVYDALHFFVANKNVSKRESLAGRNGVLVSTLIFGSEFWEWQAGGMKIE